MAESLHIKGTFSHMQMQVNNTGQSSPKLNFMQSWFASPQEGNVLFASSLAQITRGQEVKGGNWGSGSGGGAISAY